MSNSVSPNVEPSSATNIVNPTLSKPTFVVVAIKDIFCPLFIS
jgi:hypothetical protein